MYTVKNNYTGKTINSVFDEFFSNLPVERNVKTFSSVPVNIHEDENGYHLEFNAPGKKKDEFVIKLEENILTVSTESKKVEEPSYQTLRREFKIAEFKRSFTLDNKVDNEGIQAKYEDGILKVFLPKKAEVKNSPKQITVA